MQAILETKDSKYKLLKKIGHGGTCSVFKGYSLDDDSKKIFAIKIFKENAKKYFDKEILINKYLPPEIFVPIYKYGEGLIFFEKGISENVDFHIFEKYKGKIFYEIEELAENGELFDYIYELRQGFSEKISAKIFTKILKSVKILHDNRIVHCDIKPENIIVGNDFSVKLIDFGFSEILGKDNFIYEYKGSGIYESPEIRNKNMNGYDGIKSDIFSLGVLLFVITVARFPFEISSYSDRKYRLIMTKKYGDFWCYFQQYNLSNEFKDLINHLICYDPSERYSIEEILEHPWIKTNVTENNEMNINIIKMENIYDDITDKEIAKELIRRKEIIDSKTN